MVIDTKYVVSMTEANQNFSKVAKLAEENGQVMVFKNNKLRFLVVDLETCPDHYEVANREKALEIANRILKEHRGAFEKMAK